jgi:hypothetical protein
LHEEEQHIDIREKLLKLPKVKAGDDFMNALQRKINLADAEENQKKIPAEIEKESFWVKLFGKNRNPWLIPSLSLSIVAIFVITVFVLNTKKISEFPVMSDFQKKESPTGIAPDEKKTEADLKDKVTTQDLASELQKETGRREDKTGDLKGNSYEPPPTNPSPTITPKMELKMDEVTKPSSSDPVKSESGKIDYKKEERFYQDNGKSEETITPKESERSSDQIRQKISDDEKTENKDGINSKGFIEEKKDKKELKAMKKVSKTPVDSTKVDKKALEKIKEEINKEK